MFCSRFLRGKVGGATVDQLLVVAAAGSRGARPNFNHHLQVGCMGGKGLCHFECDRPTSNRPCRSLYSHPPQQGPMTQDLPEGCAQRLADSCTSLWVAWFRTSCCHAKPRINILTAVKGPLTVRRLSIRKKDGARWCTRRSSSGTTPMPHPMPHPCDAGG